MPWSGGNFTQKVGPSPIFTGPTVWEQDAAAGILIEAERHDYHDQDMADGIDACLNKNGANSPTANISWGNFNITSLAYGVNNNDAAAYGQVPVSQALNPTTNVLTTTLKDGTTFTVDLSALAVGGSTVDFARLSANQTFAGINTFSQAPVSTAGLSIPRSVGNVTLWRIAADNTQKFSVINSGTYNGSALELIASGNNAGTGYLWGNRIALFSEIPTDFGLDPAAPETITGAWTFTNPSLKLVGFQWSAATGGGNWTAGPASGSELFFSDPTGLSPLIYQIDAAPIAGAYLQIGPNNKRVWDQGSLRVLASGTPTGGEDNNLALVLTGGTQGLWCRVSGTWTKIIAGP